MKSPFPRAANRDDVYNIARNCEQHAIAALLTAVQQLTHFKTAVIRFQAPGCNVQGIPLSS